MKFKDLIGVFSSLFLAFIAFALSNIILDGNLTFSIEVGIIMFYFSFVLLIYKDRFNPFLFLLISFGLGILDIIFVAFKIRNVQNYYSIHIYEKCLFIIILWLFGFTISYFCFGLLKNNEKSKSLKGIVNNVINKSNERIILIIFLALYIYVLYKIFITIKLLGGVQNALINSSIFRYNNQGYLATLLSLCSIIPICLFELKKKKTSALSLILMLIVLMLTGRRGLIISSLLLPFLVYYNYSYKKISNKQLIPCMLIFFVIILFIGMLRNQSSVTSTNNSFISTLTNLTISTQMGENFPDTIYSLDNGSIKYQKFKYLNRGLVGLVPRKFWNNKPDLIDHSMIVSKLVYGNDKYGRPIGPFGFSYLCFGYVGVIIISILTGIISRIFYDWMVKTKTYMSIFLYSILINYVINIIKPEALMNVLAIVLVIIFCSILSNLKRMLIGGKK